MMNIMHSSRGLARSPTLLAMLFLYLVSSTTVMAKQNRVEHSVVKIYATSQRGDFSLPWQGARPVSGTGSGFIIAGKRILTNAHVVSDVQFLQIQKNEDPRRYQASVTFIAHDCDLALLTVEEETFFDDTEEMLFADALPELNDEVSVYGYPLGGARLSVTKGVLSRIDYSIYSHSGADQHLVLQVDAAINPGNSGGPVMLRNRVIGLAFQGISWADNIGYAIPVPVIKRFLNDIKDGHYDGYPELGVSFMDTQNPALRESLELPDNDQGVAVYYIDPFGSACGYIHNRDVLLSIDGHTIAHDGTVKIDDNTIVFSELLERKQCGESISLEIQRAGNKHKITIPLKPPLDPFTFRNIYEKRPRYCIYAGLVFSPLTINYLYTNGRAADPNSLQLRYLARYAKMDGIYSNRTEFVVITRRLPAPVNTYAGDFVNAVVREINAVKIASLEDVPTAFNSSTNGFHIIKFVDTDEFLLLDRKLTSESQAAILANYGVPHPSFLGAKP